ncbi:MAG TPA: hypothetical protein VLD37_02090 [Candidatus Bilamarchaeum sp.]|nr:hypothetical protein [Candidatus Bilamarchaeum sp.]
MRKLHGEGGVSRREFLKVAGFAAFAPMLGGCASTLRISRVGYGDSYSTTENIVNIEGSRVVVLYPRRNLSDARDYSKGFLNREHSNERGYTYSMRVPWVSFGSTDMGERTCDQELINRGVCSRLGEVGRHVIQHSSHVDVEYRIGRERQALILDFAQSLDSVSHTGERAMDAREFASLVRRVSGRDVRKVEVVVDNRDRDSLITAHAIPVDDSGQIISGYNIGVLALGVTFMPDSRSFYSGISLLVDQMQRTGQFVSMAREDSNARGQLFANADRIRELAVAGDGDGVWSLIVSIIGRSAEIYRNEFFEGIETANRHRIAAQRLVELAERHDLDDVMKEAAVSNLQGFGPLPRLVIMASLFGAGFSAEQVREAIRRESG